jgi:uncharacterized membrane protein YedE/YeeE
VIRRRPYADPYVAGAGLGLVLLAAFAIAGRGLGASGAFAGSAAGVVAAVAPARAASSALFARYLGGEGPWRDWLLFEVAGVAIGGFLSALAAGRFRFEPARGSRLPLAFTGGAIMGLGAVLARGCTSGLGLTGGALLSAGSWLFVGAAFAAAYLVAPLVKRAWR